MKRLLITSSLFVAADTVGDAALAICAGSVIDLDDEAAKELLASGRAQLADKGAKVKDTTKEHEAAAAEKATATPENLLGAAIAQGAAAAVKAVLEQQAAQTAAAAEKAAADALAANATKS